MAALSTLHGCQEAGVPLHFISSDTTRVDLRWQEPGPSYEAPLPAALRPFGIGRSTPPQPLPILCNADASVRSDDLGAAPAALSQIRARTTFMGLHYMILTLSLQRLTAAVVVIHHFLTCQASVWTSAWNHLVVKLRVSLSNKMI